MFGLENARRIWVLFGGSVCSVIALLVSFHTHHRYLALALGRAGYMMGISLIAPACAEVAAQEAAVVFEVYLGKPERDECHLHEGVKMPYSLLHQ